eukprot:gnl/TRDRNA2_/TRDRNA2_177051_c9_seq4.p1 gnl/TRDRNA2_/TRDRNA2_177051_c9~~gnl/TRDRNA2_/TRDRNA2_177051_c9_seq4.p1  ORF type:complete len:492 (-),score=130.18 gnl/TRDRNA2_/TRDRNA2_177051_c9_seq4:228-1523(-)
MKLAAKGGHIEVDDTFQTSIPGIYAVGDVIGPPSLASTGVFQAQQAVINMFNEVDTKLRAFMKREPHTIEDQELKKKLERYSALLGKVELFKGLNAADRAVVADTMMELSFSKGESIITQGDLGHTFYILYDGAVEVDINGEIVNRLVANPDKGEGRFFGERALIKNEPRNATIKVVSEKAKVLALDRVVFKQSGIYKKKTDFPVGMWTVPECAYFGLTKEAAEKKGMEVEEGVAKYTACLRGRVFSPDGLVKLVFKQTDGVIVGVHLIGADACELVHYGMDLVDQQVSIFRLMTTLFTAVTYHELFKEAALDGNSKLAFGAQWQAILNELGGELSEELSEEKLRQEFDAIDVSGDGSLDSDELQECFQRLGKKVNKGTIANLIRLADDDGNGTIEWPEFYNIFKVLGKRSNQVLGKQSKKELACDVAMGA